MQEWIHKLQRLRSINNTSDSGILTRIASILFITEMLGATIVAKLPKSFVGGHEFDLLLMSISISLLLIAKEFTYDIYQQKIKSSKKQ